MNKAILTSLTLCLLALIMSACNPSITDHNNNQRVNNYIGYDDIIHNGMKYRIYSDLYAKTMFVVNLTKDSLEVQKLKLQARYLSQHVTTQSTSNH